MMSGLEVAMAHVAGPMANRICGASDSVLTWEINVLLRVSEKHDTVIALSLVNTTSNPSCQWFSVRVMEYPYCTLTLVQ